MNNLNRPKITLPRAAGASQFGGVSTIPRATTDELLEGGRELSIIHSNEEYRLRITSKGKLILTK